MAGRLAALARSRPRKAQPISNPLGKFDITELWNDEQDDAGCKSLLSEMLAELDVLLSGDALSTSPATAASDENRVGHRSLPEQRLDRLLEQHAFSFEQIEATFKEVKVMSTDLVESLDAPNPFDEDLASAPPSTEWAMAAAGAKAKERPAFSVGTIAQAAAKREEEVGLGIDVPSDSVLTVLTQEEAAAQLGKTAKRTTRRGVLNDKMKQLERHASEFSTELVEVHGWLGKLRTSEKDAVDLHREQMLARADTAERMASSRRRSPAAHRRKHSTAGVTGLADEAESSDWSVVEEVSARSEAQEVLEALDLLEIEMQNTLTRFYEKLKALSREKRKTAATKLQGVEVGLVALANNEDPQVIANLRQTVAELRLQLEQSGDGDGTDAEEDPSAEVLRLLQVSADNQKSIAALKESSTRKEGKLRLMRAELIEMEKMHAQQTQTLSMLKEEVLSYQQERREVYAAEQQRVDAMRQKMQEEENAKIEAATSKVADELRKETELAALEAAKNAESQMTTISQAVANLRKQVEVLRKELEALEAAGADGMPSEVANVLSLDTPAKGKREPPLREKPSTAQLAEIGVELEALTSALEGLHTKLPAGADEAESELAAHLLIPRLISELEQSAALGIESQELVLAGQLAWQQMDDNAMNVVDVTVTKLQDFKQSASAVEETLTEILRGGGGEALRGTMSTLSEDEIRAINEQLEELEAEVERLQAKEVTMSQRKTEHEAAKATADSRAKVAHEGESITNSRRAAAEVAEAAAKARLAAIKQEMSDAEASAATEAAAAEARKAAKAREEAEEEAKARARAQQEADEAAKAVAAAAAAQDAELAEHAAAQAAARAAAEEKARRVEDEQAAKALAAAEARASELQVRARRREAELTSVWQSHEEATTSLADLEAAMAELQGAKGTTAFVVARSSSRPPTPPAAPQQRAVEDLSEAEAALKTHMAHRNQLLEMQRSLTSELEALQEELRLHEELMEALRKNLAAAEEDRRGMLAQQAKAETELETSERAKAEAEELKAQAKKRREEREAVAKAHNLMRSPTAAQPAADAPCIEEEIVEAPDEVDVSFPKDEKALLSLVQQYLVPEKIPPSSPWVGRCAEIVEEMESSLREALRRGQELMQDAKSQKTQRSAARMSFDVKAKELERLKVQVEETEALQAKAMDKFGHLGHLFNGADAAQTKQICRVMLERERIMAKIKEVNKIITTFRTLWNLSQASKPSRAKEAAKARAAREAAQKAASQGA